MEDKEKDEIQNDELKNDENTKDENNNDSDNNLKQEDEKQEDEKQDKDNKEDEKDENDIKNDPRYKLFEDLINDAEMRNVKKVRIKIRPSVFFGFIFLIVLFSYLFFGSNKMPFNEKKNIYW